MVPPAPAVGVIVKVSTANVALIVWLPWTLLKVWLGTAPNDVVPSTTTLAML